MRKKYHSPRAPCERLLDRDDVSDKIKQSLRAQLSQLDPVSLLNEIRNAQQLLADLSAGRRIKGWRTARTNELIFGQVGSQAGKVQTQSMNDTREATTVLG